jgi:hypothetical protein
MVHVKTMFKGVPVRVVLYEHTRGNCIKCKDKDRKDCILIKFQRPFKASVLYCYACFIRNLLKFKAVQKKWQPERAERRPS